MYKCKGREREYRNEWQREERKKLRKQILDILGPNCACCGESRENFLSLDHINNDGCKERKRIGGIGMYRYVRAQGFPKDKYQILCYNCNFSKGHYGQCPHINEKIQEVMDCCSVPS